MNIPFNSSLNKILVTTCIAVVFTLVASGENPENLTSSMAKIKPASEEENPYLRYVEKAEEAIGKRDWETGIAYLQEAMRSDPGNAQNVMLMSNVGMLQFYNGEDSLALRTLSEARAMAPASVVILNNRARVLTGMERLDDALRDYDLILEMDSTYAAAYQEKASIELRLGKFLEAENDIMRFRALKPNDSQGKLIQAVINANTDRIDEAISLYGELLDEKQESVWFSARAMCYLVKGDLAEAADDIANGLEIDPQDAELYYCRAYLNRLRYREEDARTDAKRALELGINPLRVKALFEKQL